MPLVLKTAPAKEPITLTEVKLHLRLDTTAYDTPLTNLIKVARQLVEDFLWRALITQTWELQLDNFEDGLYTSDGVILLPLAPIQKINSIKYYDVNGTLQTLSSSKYSIDIGSEPARLQPAYGETWPDLRDIMNAVIVNFDAGYGAETTSVPEPIRQGLLTLVAYLYENPESVLVSSIPSLARILLNPYRISRFV